MTAVEPIRDRVERPTAALPAALRQRDEARAERDALRAVVEQVRALADSEPLIVSGIRRDIARRPSHRGGTLRHEPATLGYGASGCPGDNLTSWFDAILALLPEPVES